MSTPSASSTPSPGDGGSSPWPRRVAVIIVAAILVAVLAGAVGVGYVFLRPAGPPPVESQTLVIPADAGTATPSP
jgi:hypothetical protein